MLVRLQTKPKATITLFGDVAVMHIRLMGHSGIVRIVLLGEDVPAAPSL